MKKLILASASAIALMGLAACSDTDGTTTQAVPDETPTVQPAQPQATPPTTTQPPAQPATPPAE